MHVYFVRHGETDLNHRFVHQFPNTPLSPRGREQALSAAEYLRAMNPDLLLSSDYVRARETARVIGSVLGLSPVIDAHFREVERPATLYGKSLFHPGTFWYALTSVMKRNDPRWHYHGAENFAEIEARVKRSLAFLESFRETHQSVAIVSHTMFINLITAYMCKDRILDMRDLIPAALHMNGMHNGKVVGIQYVGGGTEGVAANICRWQIVHYAA